MLVVKQFIEVMSIDIIKSLKEVEASSPGFICEHCGLKVSGPDEQSLGTKHRNHCPYCLYSKHLDKIVSGDREAFCGGMMAPVGLAFKEEGVDKYGRKKIGEIMIVHRCLSCGKISINRLAADDSEEEILNVFNRSLNISEEDRDVFSSVGIKILRSDDFSEIKKQLFGK